MRTRVRPDLLAILLGSVLVASACSAAATPAPASPTPAPQATPTAAPTGPSPLPPAEQTTLRVATAAISTNAFTMEYAARAGLFQKYGLNVTTKYIEGTGPTTQSILAGQVEVVATSAGQSILSLTTPIPLVNVGIVINKLPDYLYGGKGVTGAEQLRGKRVGISSLGGQSHAEVVVGLQKLGMTPSEVDLVNIGSKAARIAALVAGTVQAIPAETKDEKSLTGQGFTVLVRLPQEDLEYAGDTILFQKSYVDKNPNTVLRFVLACLESVQVQATNPDAVAKYYADFAQIKPEDAQAQWRDYAASGLLQRDLRSTQKAFENVRDVLATVSPEVKGIDVTKAYDWTFLDKLKEMGYFKELGVPTT